MSGNEEHRISVETGSSDKPQNTVENTQPVPEPVTGKSTPKLDEILAKLPKAAFEFRDVDTTIKEAFNYKESNSSMICDIIAMYLKGQKILYTEAKTLCEQRLNYLMIPTIVITAICTVISAVLK